MKPQIKCAWIYLRKYLSLLLKSVVYNAVDKLTLLSTYFRVSPQLFNTTVIGEVRKQTQDLGSENINSFNYLSYMSFDLVLQ